MGLVQKIERVTISMFGFGKFLKIFFQQSFGILISYWECLEVSWPTNQSSRGLRFGMLKFKQFELQLQTSNLLNSTLLASKHLQKLKQISRFTKKNEKISLQKFCETEFQTYFLNLKVPPTKPNFKRLNLFIF